MIKACCVGTTLSVQGHAGAAPSGQDLVCAAVTGLVYALAHRVTELDAQGAFEKPPEIRLESGDGYISVTAKADHAAAVIEDYRLIQSGLKLLEQNYPRQITVNERLDQQ